MDAVVVDEAETRLADLLDRVERGEEVTITRHGKVVAKLVPSAPARPTHDPERVREALRHMDELRPQMSGRFDWEEWKAYRDEGRP